MIGKIANITAMYFTFTFLNVKHIFTIKPRKGEGMSVIASASY